MALDLFGVVAPGQARCRQPDARGLRDLAQLGMRVAVKIGGSADAARADMESFGGPVVHVTEPLVAVPRGEGCPTCLVGRPGICADPAFACDDCGGTGIPTTLQVDHALVQRLVREMIAHAAARRPSVIYCEDGVVGTGLLCAALRLALGHDWADVDVEREYFERRVHRYAFPGRVELSPSFPRHAELDAQRAYLQELARVSRPAAV